MLQSLITPGALGFYNSAEITSIIILDESGNSTKFKNIYTLVCFHEAPIGTANSIRHGTKKPFPLKRKQSIIIVHQIVDLQTATNLFNTLKTNGTWKQPKCPELTIETLRSLPPIFVPLISDVPIQAGLKNPHASCQYVLEFFSEEKILSSSLTEDERKKIGDWVKEVLPIDLNFLTDRWGNIVFQLPNTICTATEYADERKTHMNIHLAWHPKLGCHPPKVELETTVLNDKVILGSSTIKETKDHYDVPVQTTSGVIQTTIRRLDNGLIIYQHSGRLFGTINIETSISHHQFRSVVVPPRSNKENISTYEVKLQSNDTDIATEKLNNWQQWGNLRNHRESVKKLERNLFFVQYGSDGKNDRQKAINDIRTIVSQYGKHGAFLWDPFCDGIDILNSIFACQYYGVPLRVITSYSKKIKNILGDETTKNDAFEDWKKLIRTQLKQGGNMEGINLEVRCQHSNHGWSFHDRFLLFPGSTPIVFSIGTSLNSIGSSHSILMKVEHAQPVIDAFNDLWKELGGAVIWKP